VQPSGNTVFGFLMIPGVVTTDIFPGLDLFTDPVAEKSFSQRQLAG